MSSIVEMFRAEDRVEIKSAQFFELVKQAAKFEITMNAVNCDVPYHFIRETMTGQKEEPPKPITPQIKCFRVDLPEELKELLSRDKEQQPQEPAAEPDQETTAEQPKQPEGQQKAPDQKEEPKTADQPEESGKLKKKC